MTVMDQEEEELQVIKGTKSPHGYLAVPISDNISKRPDGSLLVVGCPIARTGWQKYAVKDLPQKRAEDLGVDVSNPEASIQLYRPASEVFHPEFLASLNGATITDNHPPNGEFVDPTNFKKYAAGHIQNVRKGPEPLEDGEWPIIADLIISAEPLIGKVLSKAARELSLGYDFGIDREGDKIIQCGMLGNHNAVVPDGRAGDFVRIHDADPEAPAADGPDAVPQKEERPAQAAEVVEAIAYPPIRFTIPTNKEKQPVAQKKQSWLRSLMGKHLIEMARATDADPEKIMEAAESMHEEAKDDAEPPKNTQENEFKSEDKKGKDEMPEELKKDEKADDRKAAHDALDKILDKRAKDKGKAKDAGFSDLKAMLDAFGEEDEDEEPVADEVEADPAELEALLSGECEDDEDMDGGAMDEDDDELDEEELVESGEEVMDGEEGESPDPDSDDDDQADVEDAKAADAKAKDKSKAKDRARAADGATAVLRMMRPVIARTGDKSVQQAFNRALDSVKKSSRASTGSYGAFASSARARDKAPRNPNPDRGRAGDSASRPDPMTKMQEFYNSAHKGGK